MLSLKKLIIAIIVIIAAAVPLYLCYMGMFSEPVIVERETGPYTFAYEEFTGPYKDSGAVFDRVYNRLKNEGITTTLGLGIYLDDPAAVPQEKLRSRCGVVIDEKDKGKLPAIKKIFKVIELERKTRVVAEFPIKNGMSYMFGPMKCYPALVKYMESRGYKAGSEPFEVYDEQVRKIFFNIDFVKK